MEIDSSFREQFGVLTKTYFSFILFNVIDSPGCTFPVNKFFSLSFFLYEVQTTRNIEGCVSRVISKS